jgi:putative spermidine/putrescine transport system substrate-binding protein
MNNIEVDRRRFLQLAGSAAGMLAAGGLLAACGPGNGSSSKNSLRINSFGGSFEAAIRSKVVAPFEKNHNANVAVTTALGSATLTQLKAAPKGKAPYDVAYMDLVPMEQAIAANLLTKLDKSKLTNIGDIYPLAVDPKGYYVAELVAATGIAYNTDKIKTPPKSWQDLFDPKYKGKVIISDISGTAGYQFLLEAAKLNGGNENNIDPGFAALQRLKPNLASIYNTPDQAIQLLTSGEAWIGVGYSDRTAAAKNSGAPIAFAYPDEGALAVLSAMAIPSGGTNVDLAHKWIDDQISPTVMKSFLSTIPEGPTNKKVTLDASYVSKNYVPQGLDLINKLVSFDYSVVAKNLPTWTSRFGSSISG